MKEYFLNFSNCYAANKFSYLDFIFTLHNNSAMDYTVNTVISLISRIHSQTQELTNSMLSKHKLVSSHGFILYLLSVHEELTMGNLSKLINRNKSTTTVLIRKLIEEDLIKVGQAKNDTRKKIISLTEKGREYNSLTAAGSQNLLKSCYMDFSDEEKDTLLMLLKKMSRNLDQNE